MTIKSRQYLISQSINFRLNQAGNSYCRIPIVDGAENSTELIESAIRCLLVLIKLKFRTLISCSAGMSRSPAIAAATLALLTNRPLNDCLHEISTDAPHDVSPALWQSVVEVFQHVSLPIANTTIRPS